MSKRLKLSLTVFANNKLFSAALILIYTLVVSLLVMLCFFSQSVDDTFYGFLENYQLPDGYIVTSGSPNETGNEMEKEDGVEAVSYSLVMDLNAELPDDAAYQMRCISVNENTLLKLYNVETSKMVVCSEDTVAVSADFAESHELAVSDEIRINGHVLTVTDIVSSPETIAVARDDSSWYEMDSFGYLYIAEDLLYDLCGQSGIANQFQIYFEENADQQQTIDQLEKMEGLDVLSSSLFEGSSVDKQIKAGIEGTKAAVTYLPVLVILVGLLFSTLFMSQVIKNSDRRIALLKILGYSNAQVAIVFVLYSCLLSMISIVLGCGIGYVLLRTMLSIYQGVYHLPEVIISGDLLTLILIMIGILLLGIVSCLFCFSSIARLDPMMVGKEVDTKETSLPSFLNKIGKDSFDKITNTTIYRNRKRLFLSVLCSAACFILSFSALALLQTKNKGIDALFEERLGFDATVYGDPSAFNEIKTLSEVKTAEEKITFSVEYEDEVMRFETRSEDTELYDIYDTEGQTIKVSKGDIAIEEGFARRHNLKVGDCLTIEDHSFTVSVLVREYLYPVMYICPDDAKEMGYEENNTLHVVLNADVSIAEFSNELTEIEGFEYCVDNHARENSVRSVLGALDTPCVFFIAFAMIIGLTIISNMNLMSIRERKREYATMMVLGVDRHCFFKMSMTEAMVQFVLTCMVAVPVSIPIADFLLTGMSSVSQEYVLENPLLISLTTMALIFIYILFGVLITNRTIARMDVLEVLGDRE